MASAAPYFIRSARIVQIKKCSCVKRKARSTGRVVFFKRGFGEREAKHFQDEAPKVTKWERLPYTNCLYCACVRGGRKCLGFAYILRLFSYTYPTYGSCFL